MFMAKLYSQTFKCIGDCKSGRNVKVFERLFWVRGVKEYLNAEYAYLIKKSISSKAKIFMPKVDVKGIDDQSLSEMENIFHSLQLTLFSEEYYKGRSEIINQLVDEYKKIYDYMNTRYWFTDLNIGLKVLMTMLKKEISIIHLLQVIKCIPFYCWKFVSCYQERY